MATLTIDFTVPSPVPINGFIVKYRAVGTSTYTTVSPNPTSSPVVITGINSGTKYEGTIKSDCGNSSTSPEFAFTACASRMINSSYGTTVVNVCSASVGSQYISNSYTQIATGVTVYEDPCMNSPLIYPLYIADSNGAIWNIENGVVGQPTGALCGQPPSRNSFKGSGGIAGSNPVPAACSYTDILNDYYVDYPDTLHVGVTVYLNPTTTTPAPAIAFKIAGNKFVRLNNSGVVTEIGNC